MTCSVTFTLPVCLSGKQVSRVFSRAVWGTVGRLLLGCFFGFWMSVMADGVEGFVVGREGLYSVGVGGLGVLSLLFFLCFGQESFCV